MRALATDNAGNTTASTVQTNRRIDNTGPAVAITNPIAGRIRGVVSLDGTATDPAGVSLVTFEYRQGAGAWQLICSDPTASYTCGTIDTTVVADGAYDVRMSATDTLGHQTISPTTGGHHRQHGADGDERAGRQRRRPPGRSTRTTR